MAAKTVFNVTETPVQFTIAGNRVPGRSTAEVLDIADPYYTSALERGELVVLSEDTEGSAEPVAAVTEPTDEPAGDIVADAGEDVGDTPPDSKKKPSKAKES